MIDSNTPITRSGQPLYSVKVLRGLHYYEDPQIKIFLKIPKILNLQLYSCQAALMLSNARSAKQRIASLAPCLASGARESPRTKMSEFAILLKAVCSDGRISPPERQMVREFMAENSIPPTDMIAQLEVRNLKSTHLFVSHTPYLTLLQGTRLEREGVGTWSQN